jgi:hypothetical protein
MIISVVFITVIITDPYTRHWRQLLTIVLIGTPEVALIPSNNGFGTPAISVVFIKISGDLEPNVVGSRTMFTLLITQFTALLKYG